MPRNIELHVANAACCELRSKIIVVALVFRAVIKLSVNNVKVLPVEETCGSFFFFNSLVLNKILSKLINLMLLL
jgi:hypothetical protein